MKEVQSWKETMENTLKNTENRNDRNKWNWIEMKSFKEIEGKMMTTENNQRWSEIPFPPKGSIERRKSEHWNSTITWRTDSRKLFRIKSMFPKKEKN